MGNDTTVKTPPNYEEAARRGLRHGQRQTEYKRGGFGEYALLENRHQRNSTLSHTNSLLAREPSQYVKVMGYDIEAGTTVIINAWTIGRDPALWGDNAEEFRPKRVFSCAPVVDFKRARFRIGSVWSW